MSRRLQFSLASLLLVITCIALSIGLLSSWAWQQTQLSKLTQENVGLLLRLLDRARPSDKEIRELPITIATSNSGISGGGFTWDLSANSAGQVQVTIHNPFKDELLTFQVSNEQLQELRETLIRERFFELDERYGDDPPFGQYQTTTITIGQSTRTVRINDVYHEWQSYLGGLIEPARAIRVTNQIRGWFDHPNAMDLRKYNQKILDGAVLVEKQRETFIDPPRAP